MSFGVTVGDVAAAIQITSVVLEAFKTSQTSGERCEAFAEDVRRFSKLSSQLRETINEWCGLWIDAVYVNQQENRENGEQVSLMRQIYEQSSSGDIATGVLAWQTDFESTLQKLHSIIARGERLVIEYWSCRT